MSRISLTIYLTILVFSTQGQNLTLHKIESNIQSSFRGLSVVNDKVGWVAGSNGQVGRTTDGGLNWYFIQVQGFQKSDFRSLYAFDENKALIANAGSPAFILRTINAGQSWDTVYTNNHPDAFFDGIDFWNDMEGIVYGDPIDGKMLLLRTADGGKTWSVIKNAPALVNGEASFAASGTGIRCMERNQVIISTGGTKSRLWNSNDKGLTWNYIDAPIIQGKSSTGIFSLAVNNNKLLIIGGDYEQADQTLNHIFYSNSAGKKWQAPKTPTRGYRSGSEFINSKTVIATGSSGVDISYDGGVNWHGLTDEKGFHVVRKARNGSLTIIAGGNGQIGIIR